MINVRSSIIHVAYKIIPGLRPRHAGDGAVAHHEAPGEKMRQLLAEMDAESGPVPQDVQDRINALPWPD